mmetsp:Transcript_39473/g.95977  ORF Transcript_39473/g.95977 Transcript_39473/m.95977 type:complete len:215 (+) Transcript_39473:279-923(+)
MGQEVEQRGDIAPVGVVLETGQSHQRAVEAQDHDADHHVARDGDGAARARQQGRRDQRPDEIDEAGEIGRGTTRPSRGPVRQRSWPGLFSFAVRRPCRHVRGGTVVRKTVRRVVRAMVHGTMVDGDERSPVGSPSANGPRHSIAPRDHDSGSLRPDRQRIRAGCAADRGLRLRVSIRACSACADRPGLVLPRERSGIFRTTLVNLARGTCFNCA